MSGPENNPRDDEPIDRKEYEKWEAQQKGEKMPKGEPAPGCREVELVRLILSSYQTAYAKFHCEEKRKVVESHNMAIGYASAELALALQSVPSSPPHQIADVTIDAPKGVPSWVKVGPSSSPALEKLRELETTWIARSEMTPSCRNCSLEQCAYEMCADELHDVLTELEPKG